MQVNASSSAAARAMFSKLIDYAGLFPPAQLGMQEAVAEYMVERRGAYAWMLARFIVQHSRLPELRASIDPGEPFSLSVILDRGMESLDNIEHRLHGESLLRIEALEIVLLLSEIEAFAKARTANRLSALPSYVEFGRDAAWEETVPEVMTKLSQLGLGAKVRCGGLNAAAFPSPPELALFIYAACKQGVPFKATAGLHHPVRHFDKSIGVHRHGFLNLIAATALARAGASIDEIVSPLACEDAAEFQVDASGLRFGDRVVAVRQLEEMRRDAFVGYGSCSFSEPVDDLRALNLLA